jgi:hypothetical protein
MVISQEMPMSDPIPLSATDLRHAMRDPRYWQLGHPERAAYQSWVGDAWQQLHAAESRPGSDGHVWVKPYTRRRDGKNEEVSGHFRHAGSHSRPADGHSGADGGAARGTVTEEEDPGGGVERRITVRDASGGLIGRCERLTDGSQFCTLALPDGGIAVQQLQPGEGEFTPVAAPAALPFAFPALLGAATALYAFLQNRILALPGGGATADTPFLLFYRGFEGTESRPEVTVGTLPPERVNDYCPKTGEFERRLASVAAAIPREGLTPQQWGTAVHTALKNDIQQAYGRRSDVVRAEFSLVQGRDRPYGTLGSTRLDIYHRVEGTSTVCAYDIKTGQATLNANQAARIYREAYDFGRDNNIANPRVLIIELRQAP